MNSSMTLGRDSVKPPVELPPGASFKAKDAKILVHSDPDFINSKSNKYSIRFLMDVKDSYKINNSVIARFLMMKPHEVFDAEKSILAKIKDDMSEEGETN